MYERYAIYYTPEPGSTLDLFGQRWLGRNELGEAVTPFAAAAGLPDYADIIAAPRRYALHGTLMAPFRLRGDATPEALQSALAAFAATWPAIEAPPLALQQLGDFLTLQPSKSGDTVGSSGEIADLAAACVRTFNGFRAPLGDADLARRAPERLTPHQRELLMAWGYPYVFDEFRFHITLTGPLTAGRIGEVAGLLQKLLPDFSEEPVFAVRSVCLFGDPGHGQPFRLVARYPLRASSA